MRFNVKDEKGIAIVLVLIFTLICAATIVAIYVGMRTHSNVTAVIQGSQRTLTDAEDGINTAVTMLSTSTATDPPTFPNNVPTLYLKGNQGSNVIVSKVQGTGADANKLFLTSVATNGRYSRTVMVAVTFPTSGFAAFFPEGLVSDSAISASSCSIGFPVFSNKSINFTSGTIGGKLYTPGSITVSSVGYANGLNASTALQDGSKGTKPITFPSIDWAGLKAEYPNAIIATDTTSLKSGINQLIAKKDPNQVLIVETDSELTLSNGNFDNVQGTIIVIRKRDSNGNFISSSPTATASLKISSVSASNWKANIVCENNFTLSSLSMNGYQGVIYCGGNFVTNSASLSITGGVGVKGTATISSLSITVDPSKWAGVSDFLTFGHAASPNNSNITVSGWHELKT